MDSLQLLLLLLELSESGPHSCSLPWPFDAFPLCFGNQEVQAPAMVWESGRPFLTSALQLASCVILDWLPSFSVP